MKTLAGLGVAVLLAGSAVVLTTAPANAAVGLHVSGHDIVEANGKPFVMRGVNHPHVWFADETASFADIKEAGANTIRVGLGSGTRWGPSTDVAYVVRLCKKNRLICVLEVHDTTGYGEEAAAASLDQAADYWISQKSVLVGEENYVVLNIGNEPIGNVDAGQWTAATSAAITKLRAAGFQHLLMVDAPNWGQDWQYVMRDTGGTVLAADTLKNTVLSIHMYSVFSTAASITAYLDAVEAKGWPLVIGEFGWQFKDGEVDDQTIMAEAQERGLGWLAWSWSGNNDPILDISTGFDATQLTTWGQRAVNGPHGLRATAKEATVYATPPAPTTVVFTNFETGIQGWQPRAGSTVTTTTKPTFGTGQQSLLVTSALPMRAAAGRPIPVSKLEPGGWYLATAKVRLGPGTATTSSVRLRPVSPDLAPGIVMARAAKTRWTTPMTSFRWEGTAPTLTFVLEFIRGCPSDKPPTTIYLDNFALTKVEGPVPMPTPAPCP